MRRSGSVLNRRMFIIGAGSVVVAAACGTDDGTEAQAGPTAEFIDDTSRFLQALFADGFRVPSTLAAGLPARAPFQLSGGDGFPVVDDAPDTIDVTLTSPSGIESAITLSRRGVGLAVPHYPMLFEPDESGTYEVATLLNGQQQLLQFLVAEPAQVGLVQPGDPLRSVDTPTFLDARGFDPICTRFEPCPFHEVNLADVMENGRPTAFLIATPGFCQTEACGPVVDLLIDLDPTADANVVHSEVFNEPGRINEIGLSQELLGPAVTTYKMDFEPSFIVADAAGLVTARLDYAFDRDEMAAALAMV
jgi:hypothetical protein